MSFDFGPKRSQTFSCPTGAKRRRFMSLESSCYSIASSSVGSDHENMSTTDELPNEIVTIPLHLYEIPMFPTNDGTPLNFSNDTGNGAKEIMCSEIQDGFLQFDDNSVFSPISSDLHGYAIPFHLEGVRVPSAARTVFSVPLPGSEIDRKARIRSRKILRQKMSSMSLMEFQSLVNHQLLKSAIHRFEVMSNELLTAVPSPFREHLRGHWDSMIRDFVNKRFGQHDQRFTSSSTP